MPPLSRMLRVALFALAWMLAAYAVVPPRAPSAGGAVFPKTVSRTASAVPPASTAKTLYPVMRVVDGDTIDVEKDGAKVRVRFIGINAPESVDPRRPVQCFGIEASNEMKRALEGRSVRLEQDSSQDAYDKYGRLLAYVYLPDGTNVNEHMIAAGYAHEYTYRLPYRHQKEFKAAEKNAREAGLGLWKTDTCAGRP